jgi:predicted AlkP superfamily pyrophosphatase or phosphodiesterase
MEMSMVRIARTRRALRSRRYELVFGYTSGLDLIGHVSYDLPELQERAYNEMDDFVGELYKDLNNDDELLLVSDHGLQDGVHTHEAMVAGTNPDTVEAIDSILDIKHSVETIITNGTHETKKDSSQHRPGKDAQVEIKEQLEDLGYM